MVSLKPYLSVNNAVKALELYSKIFGAEILERVPVGKEQAAEFKLPDDFDLSVTTMHSTFKIGDAVLYMSDNFSGEILEKSNVAILLEPESLEQIQDFYAKAESNGCKISMKLEQQFWGDYFCSFVDPFGITWQMNFTPPQE